MAYAWNELKHKATPAKRAVIRREAHEELERIGFAKLRKARRKTQVAVARELGVEQGAVSRLEGQKDVLLSTLSHYLQALGGRLEIRAVFPEGSIEMDYPTPVRKPVSKR